VYGDGKQAARPRKVRRRVSEAMMVQTTNRFFDEAARLMNDAAGVAQGMRREFETLFRSQAERIMRELPVVQREEFEAVKEMAQLAREENEALKRRIATLEAQLGGSGALGETSSAGPRGAGGHGAPPFGATSGGA
jgi:BMFP domain-containing protein YqiC